MRPIFDLYYSSANQLLLGEFPIPIFTQGYALYRHEVLLIPSRHYHPGRGTAERYRAMHAITDGENRSSPIPLAICKQTIHPPIVRVLKYDSTRILNILMRFGT